mmetsp:Transcript_6107/g.16566  ORF Transcript_6107/g.16566 Transcript_6107/m.16566 type:complete len:203 (-) Transcript_6107:869-1477(-)
MPPPQLPRDAPVLDVVEPPEPRGLVEVGHDLELPGADGLGGALGHGRAIDPPLRLEQGLDHVPCARAQTEAHGVLRLAAAEPLVLELGEHVEARIEALATREGPRLGVHVAVVVQDGDHRQVVALAAFEIVGVVGGGHLDRARAKLHLHQLRVADDGNEAVHEGVLEHLAVAVSVARVVGVHRHRCVAQHRLWACSRHDNLT